MSSTTLSRRSFIRLGAFGATVVSMPACGYYAAESGDAYAPWDFDEAGPPELVAVRAAILAASPHNSQPWRFEVGATRIDVFADMNKSLGPMDPLGREMHVGLGCALENLVLAAEHHGRRARVQWLPAGDTDHVARVELEPATLPQNSLYFSIPARHTNRGAYLEGPPPAGLEAALREIVIEPEVALTLVSEPEAKARFRDGTIAATEAIVDDVEMNEESHRWYRHSAEDIDTHRDGITVDATGNGSTLRFFGKVTGRPSAESAGGYWVRSTESFQTTGAAFAILSTPDGRDRAAQLAVGRAFQRIHLFATQEGLALQPLNQMAERQDREEQLGLPPEFTDRLAALLGNGRRAQMLFRIGYAWDEAKKSPRRPVEWVIS